jgi:alkylglycerol monooxygenase
MNPILYAIPVFMLSIVIEAWLARRSAKAIYDIPDAITSLHHGVISQVVGLIVKFATLGIYTVVYERFRATELPMDSIWIWIGALIAYDFCYYWFHRMSHEVNFLWASHVVHHSSEYYNLSTALRQESTGWMIGWVFYLPLAIAGVSPVMLVSVGLIDLLYQYWVHTELIGRLGWFDRVFVSPSNHRVHHGQNDYCIDKNYAGILILFDRLFGTFADEREDEKVVYGIRKPLRSFNPLWGNLHYFADLWKQSLAASGWRAKLGVWIAPPGGWHEELAHFEPTNFEFFTTHTPPAMRWYVLLQYAIMAPFVTHLIGIGDHLGIADLSIYGLGILATTVTLGALLNGTRGARAIELVRTLATGAVFFLAPYWFGIVVPLAFKGFFLTLMLGSALWVAKSMSKSADGAPA